MRSTFALAIVSVLVAGPVGALEYPGTCRGASATITQVEGLDTAHARAVAQTMLPDAIAYCHYSLGRAAGRSRPSDAAVATCATKFMREEGAGAVRAEANCQTGTLSTSGPKWSNAYKLPIAPMCGDDNNQAIGLFKTLCPSYAGKIEAGE